MLVEAEIDRRADRRTGLELLGDGEREAAALEAAARRTVEREFTWERCGERTLAAYEAALA